MKEEKFFKAVTAEVKLNIGGRYFSTSVATLSKEPNSLFGGIVRY